MNATITISNSTSQLLCSDTKVHKELNNRLSFYVSGFQFTPSFRTRSWDGKFHFYKRLSGKFPTGLLSEVVGYLILKEISYTVQDNRVKPTVTSPVGSTNLVGISLRQYQLEAVENIIAKERCIVKAATNAGKTEIMAEVLRRLNLSAVVIVHRKELLHQTAKRLQDRLGTPIGKIGDGVEDIHTINVVMPQTAVKSVSSHSGSNKLQVDDRFKFLLRSDVLFLDECHNFPSNKISYFVRNCNAYYRIAMSGTPLLNDEVNNYALIGQFGGVAFEITNSELIQLGVSSVPYCFFFKIDQPGITKLSYVDAYTTGITNCHERNEIIVDLSRQYMEQGLNVLVIVRERLYDQLSDTKTRFIHGNLASSYRLEAIKLFLDGELNCLVSTVILDEGVDITNIDVLILAAGGKAPKRVLQRIGRGLRKKKSNQLIVIDFLDVGNLFLLKHSQSRINTIKTEGFKVQLVD